MCQAATPEPYRALGEDVTLTLERLLPGSIDRVWAYLTECDLRRRWLAAGTMEMRVGAPVECEIAELDPPSRLSIRWGGTGGVTFKLEPVGDMVRVTITHRRIWAPR